MSVICFSPSELANLCAACSAKTQLPVEQFFGAAMTYSQDNAACYNFQYNEDVDPVEATDLQKALPAQVDFERAEITAKLLRYNLYSNSGRDFAEERSEKACNVFSKAMGWGK